MVCLGPCVECGFRCTWQLQLKASCLYIDSCIGLEQHAWMPPASSNRDIEPDILGIWQRARRLPISHLEGIRMQHAALYPGPQAAAHLGAGKNRPSSTALCACVAVAGRALPVGVLSVVNSLMCRVLMSFVDPNEMPLLSVSLACGPCTFGVWRLHISQTRQVTCYKHTRCQQR